LLYASEEHQLPFFSAQREGRFLGAKIDLQPNLNIARFGYDAAIQQLNSEPPAWPIPTVGISQIRLKLRYRSNSNYKRLVSKHNTLTLDITDYPGEWLLDLPLLKLSYKEWCEQCWRDFQSPIKNTLARRFLSLFEDIDWLDSVNEEQLSRLNQTYTDFLFDCKSKGFEVIQPGRFVLPGELKGAPVLQFVPVDPALFDKADKSNNHEKTALDVVSERFEHYKKTVVKPFYREHFQRFDRQIVLVDPLNALNRGKHSFGDLGKALHLLLDNFDYGQSSLLKRLFMPKIDKLLFAASKVDHVTQEQQPNVVQLLQSMIAEKRRQVQFEGVETESTAIASIRASIFGEINQGQDTVPVLKGTSLEGKDMVVFPGDVPVVCPDEQFWDRQGFEFPRFRPMTSSNRMSCPHLRLDQALEFLLGDKLK
jgi:predicted YcjX-like family ATPase